MFETFTRVINENKIKATAGAIGFMITLGGALWAVDDRYAHAADVDGAVNSLQYGQKSVTVEMQIQLNKQSMRDLRGKINDIEDKQTVTKKVDPIDANKKKRLEQDLIDLKTETDRLEIQKFELEKQMMRAQQKR